MISRNTIYAYYLLSTLSLKRSACNFIKATEQDQRECGSLLILTLSISALTSLSSTRLTKRPELNSLNAKLWDTKHRQISCL